jgi:hypothetical protein
MKIIATCILSLVCIQLLASNKNNEITDTMRLRITIGTSTFISTLYNNATANAFKAKLPMTITMVELNGNEKYFELSGSLPTNASIPSAIRAGDLMIYGSNTLVLFYKTFSTSYSYTKLGHIDNTTGLATALGSGNKTVTFEIP